MLTSSGEKSFMFVTLLFTEAMLYADPSPAADFFFAIVYGVNKYVAFCRSGDVDWTLMDESLKHSRYRTLCFVQGNSMKLIKWAEFQSAMKVIPDYEYKTDRFDVYELDANGTNWLKLENLADQILFLGWNSPLTISATKYTK
ncbi:hypothetical protein SADUNF_Sadunf02G0013200 [Salix dunnii]|uniref:KIB1-4 beta-propeller domain-containing protein n=1 Tax=Salix dunnii TaxID=1413687 RepID=A0A835N5N5_9ROSI|nr:hypothetical protein SADUNF_Sadunf02G0013200 [Salix dunnii]